MSPLKPLRARTNSIKQTTHLDSTYPHATTGDVFAFSVDCVVFQQDAPTNRVVIQQLLELGQNAEWQRCGVFLTCREDGPDDKNDAWVTLDGVEMPEMSRDLGWSYGRIDVSVRIRQQSSIGVFADQKLQPNDAGLGGLSLVAFPQGVSAQTFPAATWSFAASDGSTISVVESPVSNLRAALVSPTNTMTSGRVSLMDEV